MSDTQKFEAFKKDLVQKNEQEYGAEVRKRWGDDVADATNQQVMGLSKADYERAQHLEQQVKSEVLAGLSDGDPNGTHAERAAQAHAEWLRLFWPKGLYSPQAHASLAQMYLADERFRQHYED
ncbi:MAG: TipAS antibiotic-recognition domain-containing protein [Atopobiaceae bacterium]